MSDKRIRCHRKGVFKVPSLQIAFLIHGFMPVETWLLTLCLLVPSADNLCKQFGPRSDCWWVLIRSCAVIELTIFHNICCLLGHLMMPFGIVTWPVYCKQFEPRSEQSGQASYCLLPCKSTIDAPDIINDNQLAKLIAWNTNWYYC